MVESNEMLKVVVDSLRSIAKGFEDVAVQMECVMSGDKCASKCAAPAADSSDKPAEKQVAKKAEPKKPRKPVRKRVVKKAKAAKAPAGKKGKVTATGAVLDAILGAPGGIDTKTLANDTGFPERKIRNIIMRLKKQGKIKTKKRGVYIKP